jgi:hypothetical protein
VPAEVASLVSSIAVAGGTVNDHHLAADHQAFAASTVPRTYPFNLKIPVALDGKNIP